MITEKMRWRACYLNRKKVKILNDELKQAAWMLKEYCSNRACCTGCPFKRKPTYRLQEVCKIGYPDEWSVRKESKHEQD